MVRLTDRPDMTLDVYRGRKTTMQQQQQQVNHSAKLGGKTELSFRFYFNTKVYCVLSLESPNRGDSNECTKYTIFTIKKIITLNCPKSAAIRFFSKGLKSEFETAVVNEPPVFEPLKFYCK